MKLKEIVEKLDLNVIACEEKLENEVTGAYASDLLSDVIANSKEGNLWLTLQTHQNIIAVATLKELSGIVIVNNREPDEETVKKAEQEKIPLMTSNLTTFELAGKLYEIGLRG